MTDQSVMDPNESQDQHLTLRSGRNLKHPNLKNKKPGRRTNSPDPPQNPQSEIHHPQPALPTQTDFEPANEWKNLDNPYSFSGNTVTILDKIKSFS